MSTEYLSIYLCLFQLLSSIFGSFQYTDLSPPQLNINIFLDFPGGSDGKRVCLQRGRPGFDPWVGKTPWRRKQQPTPVLLPGKSYGPKSLVGYSPWGRKELDRTERLHLTCNHTPGLLFQRNENIRSCKNLQIMSTAILFVTAPNWKQCISPSGGEK